MTTLEIPVPLLFFLLLGIFFFSPVAACEIIQSPAGIFENPTIATIDNGGNIYITGYTSAPSFTANGSPRFAENRTYFGLFVIKIEPGTPAINYSTWYQRIGYVDGRGIAIDEKGSALILVESESENYPASWSLADEGSFRGSFITQFSPDGTRLDTSYRIFSSQHLLYKPATNLVRGPDGSLYLALEPGDTAFPVTKNFRPFGKTGSEDIIVIKIQPDGKKITYADRIGSDGGMILQSMDVAPDGSAYVTGFSYRGQLNSTGFQKDSHGNGEGFIGKISPDGENLEYLSYLGGSGTDRAVSVRAGPDGSAYVAGFTDSVDFPSKNPAVTNYNGPLEGFAGKISSDGQNLIWSTYLGEVNDETISIVPSSDGGAWVVGGAGNTMAQRSKDRIGATGNGDAFLVKISPEGQIINSPVVFGGLDRDTAVGLVLDKKGNPFVFGTTRSSDFPLKNPPWGKFVPGTGMFVASFNASDESMIYSTFIGGPTAYRAIWSSPSNEFIASIDWIPRRILETVHSFFVKGDLC